MNRGRPNRRGRGRGGFRGGRGTSRHRINRNSSQNNQDNAQTSDWDLKDIQDQTALPTAEYDIEKVADIPGLFSANSAFDHHVKAQDANKHRYVAAIQVLDKNGADISQSARVRSLAAAWARCDDDTAKKLLKIKNLYGLPEVLKAVLLLDAGRKCRQLERKLEMWQTNPKNKVKTKKLGKLKSEIDNLKVITVNKGTLTKRVTRHVADWVKEQTKEDLEYFASHMPKDPWKKLADLCHLHPQKDFPSTDWFLAYCFGSPAPEGSMVQVSASLSPENVNDVLKEFEVPYSHIRQHVNHTHLTELSKMRIASYASLDLVLWYYEELGCKSVDQQILTRLQHGHQITLPLGKLLERLLALKMVREGIGECNTEYEWNEATETLNEKKRTGKATDDPVYLKIAELCKERLKNVVVPIEGPVAVLGDKSGSMDIAIRSSTLLACIVSAITSAKLVFFNNKAEETAIDASDILQVLELAVSIQADKSTAPAAGLWHFYEKKEVIKTFIMATDEEENTRYKNYFFAELYKKYHNEVYPARLVFVSFLAQQHTTGQMVSKLEALGFTPQQFKFNVKKPDLTKFDKLLGLLSTDSTSFEEQLVEATAALTLASQGTTPAAPNNTLATQCSALASPGATPAASNITLASQGSALASQGATPAAQDEATTASQVQEQKSTTTAIATGKSPENADDWEIV